MNLTMLDLKVEPGLCLNYPRFNPIMPNRLFEAYHWMSPFAKKWVFSLFCYHFYVKKNYPNASCKLVEIMIRCRMFATSELGQYCLPMTLLWDCDIAQACETTHF